MSLFEVATAMGITTHSLGQLLKGEATFGFASRLGVKSSAVQDFINGSIKPGIPALLGVSASTAKELRDVLGKEGAIGIIVGLAIKKKRSSLQGFET